MPKRPDGTGSIYSRGGVLWIRWRQGGRQYRESTKQKRVGVAQSLLRARLLGKAAGQPTPAQVASTTVEALVALVRADYTANGRRSIDSLEDFEFSTGAPVRSHMYTFPQPS